MVHIPATGNTGRHDAVQTKHVERLDSIIALSALVRTVGRGGQAAAARELGVTPAMVGRYIQALEEWLGTRLLCRTTARRSLTEPEAAFYTRASAILEPMKEAEANAADREAEPRGTLRIDALISFGARHLAAAPSEFCDRDPTVWVELVLSDRVVDLVEEGYDVAVR